MEDQATDSTDEAAAAVLEEIKKTESDILNLYMQHSRGPVGYQHFYLFGIARRALAQSTAFRELVAQRNSLVASSIIRMQLDTVLRLYALFWVADPNDFAEKVFKGTEINRLKAADGKLMSDAYLKDRLATINNWMPAVYKETSGYIHFSNRHIKAAIRPSGNNDGHAELLIGPQDIGMSLSYYGEMLRAFRHLTMMIPVAAADLFGRVEKSPAKSIGALSANPSIKNTQTGS